MYGCTGCRATGSRCCCPLIATDFTATAIRSIDWQPRYRLFLLLPSICCRRPDRRRRCRDLSKCFATLPTIQSSPPLLSGFRCENSKLSIITRAIHFVSRSLQFPFQSLTSDLSALTVANQNLKLELGVGIGRRQHNGCPHNGQQ